MICDREDCDNEFSPKQEQQRFCSPTCRWRVNGRTDKGKASKAKYDASPKGSICHAEWYACGGWYVRARYALSVRTAQHLQQLEDLYGEKE